ncbi:MAG TPA: FAD-dependent oxidoreductase [Conexibacter sp.]|nr:FAD-dependent oxidoreductase [Conexibacter sp.]
MSALARRNGEVSFWQASLPANASQRPPLTGDRDADVCIAGAGFTGLWTAYELKRARPELEVVVLERERVGFGASGRNGGWLTSTFAAPRERLGRAHGRDAVLALERAMQATVAEVLAVCEREGIDADVARGGLLRVARTVAQVARLRTHVEAERAWGIGPDDLVELDASALGERVRVAGALGATFSPHGARVQPAKLARGLAEAAERLGVTIHERTAVRELRPGDGSSPAALTALPRRGAAAAAVTDYGTVRAPVVLSCLEGFTAGLPGERRRLLPLTSAMIATEPLPAATWDEIAWSGAELLGDAAHAFVYAQRTADGRIALGGRGTYRYGSRTDRAGRTERRTIASLGAHLRAFFPPAADAAIDHAWCGVIGVARDWQPAVRFDPATGLGSAGGYVGHGVATANLAGRTLRDLVLGEDSELTRLPWVGHDARRWEPEPLRWIGATTIAALYRAADRREAHRGDARTSRLAHAADRIAGRA